MQIALFKVIEIAGNQVFFFRRQLDGLFHVFCRTVLVAHQQVNASSFLIQLRFLRNQFNSFLVILERLVQLFFLYYGLPKIGIRTDAAVCGIAGLAFLGGSYMAEAFRSGLEAIEPIQTESALSLGMSRLQTMRYVVLPQAVSISMPAFMANIIFLLKETSVFSAISLMDLMFTAKDLIGLYYKTAENLFLLVVFYLIILLPVSLLGSWLERRLRYAGFGA